MDIIDNKLNCTGCSACVSVCPQECISMIPDEEGFLFPAIDEEKCVKCGLCKSICMGRQRIHTQEKNVIIAYNIDNKVREESSSGGIFSVFAEYVLKNQGVVFGAAFDDNFMVCHIEINSADELHKIRGSKYVQSKIGDSYIKAKKYLMEGKLVLFSGTPCQIAGLRSYLGQEYDQLICVDVICMGVPSPYLWELYKDELCPGLYSWNFRDKTKGWRHYNIRYATENQIIEEPHKSNIYMQSFLKKISLRKSCYDCEFKGDSGKADITIGDCWGYEDIVDYPQNYNVDLGLSVIIQRTDTGREFLKRVSNQIVVVKVEDYGKVAKYNPMLDTSGDCPKERFDFFDDLSEFGVKEAIKNNLPLPRDKQIIKTMEKLVKCMYEENILECRLCNLGYKKIAIYGMGTIGKMMYSLLKNSNDISVEYYTDRRQSKDIPLKYFSNKDIASLPYEDIDAIVVTPSYCYGNILFNIKKYTDKSVLAIGELIC